MKLTVDQPASGWGSITHTSVGVLKAISGESVVVDFPECKDWSGLLAEIEKSRDITVGDKVKVS